MPSPTHTHTLSLFSLSTHTQVRIELSRPAPPGGGRGPVESFRTLKHAECWVAEGRPAHFCVAPAGSDRPALRLAARPPFSLAGAGVLAGRLGLTWPRAGLDPGGSERAVTVMLRDGEPGALAALRSALVAAVSAAAAAKTKTSKGLGLRATPAPPKRARPASASGAGLARANLHAPSARIFNRAFFESGGAVGSGGGGGRRGGDTATAAAAPSGCGLARQRAGEDAATTTTARAAAAAAVEPLPPLCPEQAAVLAAILGGASVYFGGPAGTGKSLLLKHALAALPVATTAVTAPTALAASALGGTTIHAWAGIGRADSVASAVAAACRPAAAARWRAAAVLVMDEVSMAPGSLLDLLDAAGRAARGTAGAPFGGLQLVLCGDFAQLPPVAGVGGAPRTWAFQAACWAAAVPRAALLTTVHRQAGDPAFIALLGRLRAGGAGGAELEALRVRTARPLACGDGILPTALHTHRRDVDAVNAAALAALPGEGVALAAIDEGDADALARAWSSSSGGGGGGGRGGGGGSSSTGPPRSLTLKVGAQVVLTRTLDPVRGLVNGARGVVVAFRGRALPVPLVRFSGAGGSSPAAAPPAPPVEIHRARHALALGGRTLAARLQVPLALGWALSVHRAQGMTLDRVAVRLDGAFEAGMAYVALSRVRSVEGLQMTGGAIPRAAAAADPAVTAFYAGLVEKGAEGRGVAPGLGTTDTSF